MAVQEHEGGTRTFIAGAALAAHRRVRLSSGKLAYASDSSTDALGTLQRETFADLDAASVRKYTDGFSHKMVASEAITAGVAVYAATNGRVASTGTVLVGLSLTASAADGDYLEVAPSAASILGAIARSALTQDALKPYTIPLTSLVVHDAMQTKLPGTSSADDMALITGTPGTDAPTLQGVDFGGTTSDEKGSFEFVLPAEYDAGETVTVRVRAAMLTTVSDGTATVDVECWKADGDGAVGTDICATAAASINSLTPANKDFTITPTGLVAGDKLIIRLSFAGSDTGNVGVMIPEISNVAVLCDVKG